MPETLVNLASLASSADVPTTISTLEAAEADNGARGTYLISRMSEPAGRVIDFFVLLPLISTCWTSIGRPKAPAVEPTRIGARNVAVACAEIAAPNVTPPDTLIEPSTITLPPKSAPCANCAEPDVSTLATVVSEKGILTFNGPVKRVIVFSYRG